MFNTQLSTLPQNIKDIHVSGVGCGVVCWLNKNKSFYPCGEKATGVFFHKTVPCDRFKISQPEEKGC